MNPVSDSEEDLPLDELVNYKNKQKKIKAEIDANGQKQAKIRKDVKNMKTQRDLLKKQIHIKENIDDMLGLI